jgi:hypothetical protein
MLKMKKYIPILVVVSLLFGAWNSDIVYAADSVAQPIIKVPADGEVFDGCRIKLLDPSFPAALKEKMDVRYVYTWLSYVVPSSATTAQAFFNKDMGDAREQFTPQGWEEFNTFLTTIDFKNFLFSNNNTASIRSFLITAPQGMSVGTIHDANNILIGHRYIFRVKLQSTFFESGNRTEKTSLLLISIISEGTAGELKLESWKPDTFSQLDKDTGAVANQVIKGFIWKREQVSGEKK